MVEGSAAPIFQKRRKIDKDSKDNKIDKLCKQVENLHFMMMKPPTQAPEKGEAVC